MATAQQVTVDKSYFDALLRRADFHTSAQILGRQDPASVNISRVEYDALLASQREYEVLKRSLFQGGLTPDTLALLINSNGNNSSTAVQGKDSLKPVNAWADDFDSTPLSCSQQPFRQSAPCSGASWRTDDPGFDEADSFLDDGNEAETTTPHTESNLRTLYFAGLHARTTYRDLLSVIKGGKLLSINMRSERSATVTFLDAAADYLTWAKRNDIYLHSKRIEVRWADRQFQLNGHINNKIMNGATRNLLIKNAMEKALPETVIRDDMEHIHGLIIIDIVYRNGDAYVSTNSIHNALFARTCMMSRKEYRGCRIEFFPDECDVPIPARNLVSKAIPQETASKKVPLANRFGMLDMDGANSSSNEENRAPYDSAHSDDDDETIYFGTRHGVRLDFLDSESNA